MTLRIETPESIAAHDLLTARVKALAAELPGISFGYIGNMGYDRSGWYDDRSWRIFLPHPGRMGTPADDVYIGSTDRLENAAARLPEFEAEARRRFADPKREERARWWLR